MEEEIHYSTMFFKNGGTAPKEKTDDPTIYSEVKPAVAAATVPNGDAGAHFHFRIFVACLGILCVCLVASIIAIIYISTIMEEQQSNVSDLTAENEKLIEEKSLLEQKTVEMSRVTDNLNWTMRFILNFNTFPVNKFCPDKQCQPCQDNWILFQEKCYLFYEVESPWKTWHESQRFCQNEAADLLVIDNLHEQEFISNHTRYYFDRFHGYWIGLYGNDNNRVWVDGHNDTLGYWMTEDLGRSGPCTMTIPQRMPTASWDPSECVMRNKFICESDVMIRSY